MLVELCKFIVILIGVFIFIILPIGALYLVILDLKNKFRQKPLNILQNKISTEYFEIDIAYDILNNGRISATLKVVKSPNGIRRIIFNGGSLSLENNFKDYVIIEAKTIEDLHEELEFIISNTKENIQEIEKNLKAVEINKLVLEVGS